MGEYRRVDWDHTLGTLIGVLFAVVFVIIPAILMVCHVW